MAEVALREYVNEIDGMIENSAYDVAIQHCRHILSQYPKHLETYRVLGKALLEKDDYAAAGDVFRRVLSVDPEDFVARVGLSIVHDRLGELDQAIWQMERAYDLMPSNEIIQSELRRLYGRRDGAEPERVSLTRSALARMYAHGDLHTEAITTLRELLIDQPDRVDLQVLLAEVLWRDEQRIEAADLAQTITAQLPYCLKANLIQGDLLNASGGSDSDLPFRRAQAIDPDNLQAAQLFGLDTPLPVRNTQIARLEQMPYGELLETEGAATDREEVPDWLRGLAELNTPAAQIEAPESATNPPLPTGLHMPGTQPLQSEIPEWLQGLTTPQEATAGPSQELPDWLAAMGTATMESTPAQPAAAAPADNWLAQVQTTNALAEPATAMRDEEVPDWIVQLGTGALDPRKLVPAETAAEEVPDWMKQLGATGSLEAPLSEGAPSTEVALSTGEVPDWLRQLGTGALGQTAATRSDTQAAVPNESDSMPDWLRQLGTGALDQTARARESGENATPDWLSQLQATAPASGPASGPLNKSVQEEIPDWLTELQRTTGPLPTPENPPAARTSARKIEVDADRATVERLVEAFSPTEPAPSQPAEAKASEPGQLMADAASEIGKAGAGLVLGGAALAGAAASGLAGMMKSSDRQPEEKLTESGPIASEVSQPAGIDTAAIPEGDVSPADALAFLARLSAGKEDQLRANAEAEAESRMAAIMGRKPVEPAVETKPIEPTQPVESGPETGVAAEAASTVSVATESVVPEQPEPATLDAAAVNSAAIPEGNVSPEDALAFLARLSAGKEDQLKAQAEAEAESRMAVIMGRKPVEPAIETKPAGPAQPVEPGPVIEPVAEAAPARPITSELPEPAAINAAAILEGDVSPEEALAFLARLSAGKEDQLRANAEAEAELRMAAIMGRKPTAPLAEEKPVEPMQPVEPEPAAEVSPAWLNQLSALAAETPTEPAEETQSQEDMDWLRRLNATVVVAPTPSDELPEWLRTMRPSDETAESVSAEPLAEIDVTPAEELPAWLQAMQPSAVEEEHVLGVASDEAASLDADKPATSEMEPTSTTHLPDWLTDLQPAAMAVEATAAAEAAAPEDLPAWLRDLQPASTEIVDEQRMEVESGAQPVVPSEESVAPVSEQARAEAEPVKPVESVAIEREAVTTTISSEPPASRIPPQSVTWWTQSADDEGEQPIAELPEPLRIAVTTPRVTPAAPAAARPPSRLTRDRAQDRSVRETRRRERSVDSHRTEPPPMVTSVNVDPLVEQLAADKYNHGVRLELARAWWSMGNRDSALDEYGKLINPAQVEDLGDEELEERDFTDAGPLADDIIADLERIAQIDDHPAWPRLLGDLYMKTGDLARALEMYRRALSQL